MYIRYAHGDLLKTKAPVIVNQCNAQGRYASGIAAAIRAKHPEAYAAYMERHETTGLHLGDIIVCPTAPYTVIHTVSQDRYGNSAQTGIRYTDYDALQTCLEKVDEWLLENNCESIGFPLLGAGLAGGSWSVISELIEKTITQAQPIVYVLDGVVPGYERFGICPRVFRENYEMFSENGFREDAYFDPNNIDFPHLVIWIKNDETQTLNR